MKWTKWNDIVNEDGEPESKKIKTTIPLVDCFDFLPGGVYENEYSEKKIKFIKDFNMNRVDDSKFLCPQGVE